jgi:hypothetical protein
MGAVREQGGARQREARPGLQAPGKMVRVCVCVCVYVCVFVCVSVCVCVWVWEFVLGLHACT